MKGQCSWIIKGQCSWIIEGKITKVKCQCGKPTGFVMVADGDQVLRRKYPAFCTTHQVAADKRAMVELLPSATTP